MTNWKACRRRLHLLLWFCCAFLLVSFGLCGSGLAQEAAKSVQSRDFRDAFQRVWQAACKKAAEKGSIVNLSRRNGRFWVLIEYGNIENHDNSMRELANLPEPLPDSFRYGDGSVKVSVRTKDSKTTELTIQVFFILRANPSAAATIQIPSNGKLETQLLDAIAGDLAQNPR